MRRIITAVLVVTLLLCLLAALVGAVLVVLRDPEGSLRVTAVAVFAAAALTGALGAPLVTTVYFAPFMIVFALGLYALHVLYGVSTDVLAWIAGGIAGLVVLTLGVGLSGTGDPYDDD